MLIGFIFFFKLKPKKNCCPVGDLLGSRLACLAVLFCLPGALGGFYGLSQVHFSFRIIFCWCLVFFFCFLGAWIIFATRNSDVVFDVLFLPLGSVVFFYCFCALWGAVSLSLSWQGLIIVLLLRCSFCLLCFRLFLFVLWSKLCIALLCFCRYVYVCCLFSRFRPVCFFACFYFRVFLRGAFALIKYPLCAPVTRLAALVPPRQTLFSFVFWLFGRAQTTDNGHPRLTLPPSRVPTLDYVPLHPCTPMNAHHGHT